MPTGPRTYVTVEIVHPDGTTVAQRWIGAPNVADQFVAAFGQPVTEWIETDDGSAGYSDAYPINEDGSEPE
ncbi:hypothetical protein [Microbispora sp. GKU 823]|uniref:hypothetical protein n=1 Tax=Microbispora sp. GKU 823 TaxID=1652100 RepID=UPI0009A35690|nr:hypothetical protein [Microbispora sp. GKU 823]OPG13668.1 hypothetical protein B1L11_06685 [Microbispora sp. GKU 823]